MRVSKLEISIIGLLLVLASAHASLGSISLPVIAGHIVSLLVLFILVSRMIASLNDRAARIFFAATALILASEIIIQFLTGLHLNWFVISLLMEGSLKQNTGISPVLLGVTLLATTTGLYWASTKFSATITILRASKMLVLGLVAAGFTQIVYGTAYYHGSTDAVQVRRSLPFLWTLHPYQANKLLGYIFAPRDENPFSMSKVEPKAHALNVEPKVLTPITNRVGETIPNILIIVTDSLRSSDIRQKPSLAPTLFSAAQKGFFSLDYYSVSNCTHFSLYSMATGELPTRYGAARDQKIGTGFFSELAAAGYRVSTAESASLDWYDLSDIIIPVGSDRWISENDDTLENDQIVTAKTIQTLSEWQQSTTPGLHFAYYYGTHYPYSDTLNASTSTKLEAYETAISRFDAELAKVLTALETTNTLDNTLVIVTSDHGEEFYEDGRVGHASRLSMQQVQVPLLILGATQSRTVPKSHLDIPELIYSTIEPTRPEKKPSKNIYLANCGYDFPSGFSVLKSADRFDFDFDNGYLVPINFGKNISPADGRAAAAELLKAIR